ncbi:fimbrial protein [Achromobacter sp. MY14]|uniref:fimbrial protein n=1 Tax=Achromobacter TaxID=222 RepID=UPI000F8FAC1B|nr:MULTISPECIES: fimbrial protein [Achromobacter]AZS77947.1 fimbrial protein [Achromobacter spanius]MCD0495367.1 fimbrial protein [Achromobacter sp. MY14]
MVAPAIWRRRLLHVVLTAGVVCPLPAALADTLDAPPFSVPSPAQSAPVLMARGIGVLSPVQPIPVRPAPSIAARAVPLDPPLCGLEAAEPALDTSVRGGEDDGSDVIPGLGTGLSGGAQGMTPECQTQPTAIVEDSMPDYSFALEDSDIPRVPVVVISGVSRPTRPWFASVSGQDGLRYGGDRNWVYRNTAGPSLTVGNINANAPVWGSSAPVGGLQIANWAGSAATVPEGSFGYSSSVGKLNRMDPAARSGPVDYGASVGSGSVRYGLTPVLTLEGQMQSAPALTTRGLGTTYAAGEYGTFQAGATQSSFDASNAWRYRFGYNVDVADMVNLGYTNEQIGAGFGDLSTYSGGVASAAQTRNTLSAGVPITGWGTFSGTYSGLREGSALAEQRVGLSHSMFVAPKVQLAVGADRDIVSGNYEWRANLSMPVDTFMRGTWLSW